MNVRVTSLSSKGQVVIPSDIREKLGISSGANFLVLTDGSNLLLKPINAPQLKSFEQLIKESRKLATTKKLKKGDVTKMVKSVRNEGRSRH